MLTIGLFSTAAWMMDPRIRALSSAARGTFVDMLACADMSETTGTISINGRGPAMHELARMFQMNEPRTIARHVAEIVSNGLVTVDSSGVISIPLQSYIDRHLSGHPTAYTGHLPGIYPANARQMPGKCPANAGEMPEVQSRRRGKSPKPTTDKPVRKTQSVQISSKTNQISELQDEVSFRAGARAVVVDSILESKNLESVEEREGTVSQPNLPGALNHKKTNREDSGGGEGGVGGDQIDRKKKPADSVGAQKARPSRPPRARGSRIDPEFSLTPELRDFAVGLGVNPDWELGKFVDYWLQREDVRSYKLDWGATWRNWVRKEVETPSRPNLGARSSNGVPQRELRGAAAMSAYLARQRDLAFGEVDEREKFEDGVVASNAPVIDGTILP